ncbi:MAG: glutathione S-transferase family protein [Alphaproteobacteria bacterium]
MKTIELFSYPTCPFSQRVVIALNEKCLEYKTTYVKLRPAEAWFKKLSPYGEVPAIKHGEVSVAGSTVVNEYIEDVFPQSPLLPSEAAEKAEARFWLSACGNRLLPACHALIRDKHDEAKQRTNRDRLDDELIYLSNAVAKSGGPYWMGADFTLVDATFAPFFERFFCYQEIWGARWPKQASALKGWWDAVQERESVSSTLRERSFHLDIYRGYDEAA